MRMKAVAIALALTIPLVSDAEPADRTVWRVGVFDGSSGEFADGAPHGAVHCVAGQDQPHTAWYAFARAASAGRPADAMSAPRYIDFSIAGRPETAYRLKVSLLTLDYRSQIPTAIQCIAHCDHIVRALQ
jgi:hypothetical protein